MHYHHRQSQVIKQRILRHNRLMKLIKSYNPSDQQMKKLERVKVNTMMEINIRYLRCDHNRHYKFPKNTTEEQSDSEEEHYDQLLQKKQNIVYDLKGQNQMSARSLSNKVLSLQNKKVTSLQIQRNNDQRERLLRLQMKSNKNLSSKNLSRKNSFTDKLKKDGMKVKLPQLKNERVKEYLKTQGRNIEEQGELNQVINKKLITEISESSIKIKGVEKYLKKMEQKKQGGLKSNFKKRVFLPDKI